MLIYKLLTRRSNQRIDGFSHGEHLSGGEQATVKADLARDGSDGGEHRLPAAKLLGKSVEMIANAIAEMRT